MTQSPDAIVGKTCEGRAVTWAEIEEATRTSREWLELKTTTGACSAGLVRQLAEANCRIPHFFGKHMLLVHFHAVLDQIGELERAPLNRATATKAPAPLTGPLTGLWHKHWFQAAFLPKNLLEETQKYGDMLIYKHLNTKFGRDQWIDRPITQDVVGSLVHATVFGAISHRSGSAGRKESRLTGEWIVFAKAGRRNIYLTLAGHDETNDAVLSRCLPAAKEFPELALEAPFARAR